MTRHDCPSSTLCYRQIDFLGSLRSGAVFDSQLPRHFDSSVRYITPTLLNPALSVSQIPDLMSTSSPVKSSPALNDTLSVRLVEGVIKDVRAHEHARHRAKERREHAQAKERKEKVAVFKALGMKLSSHGQGAKTVRRPRTESWDAEDPELSPSSKPSSVILQSLVPFRASTDSFTELTLGDLISVPRPKKAMSMSSCYIFIACAVADSRMVLIELDFEVIPPVRAVIALNDATDDVEPDEPWEYITTASLNDQLPEKERSYAQAAAAATIIATQ